MKKITLLFFLTIFSIGTAQVGIGTTNPQAELHVAGDLLVQSTFQQNGLNTVSPTEENFKLLTRTTNSTPVGEITVLDTDNLSVAPVNTIDYHFTNIKRDNITDLDLQYDTSKYVVAISNYRYVGDAIRKTTIDDRKLIGNSVVRVFESNGTWHIEIRNRDLDLRNSDTVEYYITLIVYDKSYFRNLTPITTDLNGSNTGTATSVPVLN
ncbi:hypothetical protein [Ulvibacter litoralis]|uniref:Uncharacterized protein n=1 Tax=Ulvibacter litoralis TaxID=227084 RepID=A0A1G7FEF1_9FLAO|nr:hypothetical protein [Ulvibacter litoralis]GHC51479.1 hypothetical protein GCM10008083_13960 [Ulvibacter litoralis]SDE74288.1 hypothetical protein SAMN05421855_102510 [Ulvibacter litoralis]